MKIQSTPLSLIQPHGQVSSQFLQRLQLGQQIGATVVKAPADQNRLWLNLGGQLVCAESSFHALPGQRLLLEVIQTRPLPQLKLIQTDQEEPALLQAMRQNLPKQQSLTAFYQQLWSIMPSGSPKAPLASNLQDFLRIFMQTLPKRADLTTVDGLKRAVENSGLFLEPKLALLSEGAALGTDLKAQLLRLFDALDPAAARQPSKAAKDMGQAGTIPGTSGTRVLVELLGKVEGAIAKLVLDQLAAAPLEENGKQIWPFELPFLDGHRLDSAKLLICRERARSETGSPSYGWSVMLELHPPALGKIHCKIGLHGEQINTYFWSERKATAELIKAHAMLLDQRLRQAGLQPVHLEVNQGAPPQAASAIPSKPLVDTHA